MMPSLVEITDETVDACRIAFIHLYDDWGQVTSTALAKTFST